MIVRKYIIHIFTLSIFVFSILETSQIYGAIQENSKIPNYRLSNSIKPLSYQVYLDPCISDGNFSGYVKIDLIVAEATRNISLHSQDLQFCEEGVYLTLKRTEYPRASKNALKANESNGTALHNSEEVINNSSETVSPIEFLYDRKEETVTMAFKDVVRPAKYWLEINYLGSINTIPKGLYREFHNDPDGERRVMLLTNFYPISARRIFPCRDEPAVKSEIHLTMQTSLNFTTIMADLPKNYVEYKEGQRWTHFQSMTNVSTYQLNFAVLNNVKNITKAHLNKTLTIYTSSSDLKSIDLATDIYERSMTALENYTEISYPLNNFINLVLPEKTAAAPSSALGFIITKLDDISYNDQLGPHKKISVVLHSSGHIVSQWFGQLISPANWKHMWLTNGLGEFMKYHVAHKIMPDLRLQEIFVIRESQRKSFLPNKITDSSPLNRIISDSPTNIEYLLKRTDSLSSKSASILRMMSNFLTEKIFQSGIARFLKSNKYGPVKPDNFWDAMQGAVNASKDTRLANMSIKKIMRTWTNSELYPIINVTRNYTSGSIKITQIPAAILFGTNEKNVTNKWYIPINFATRSNPRFNTTFPSHWIRPDTKRLTVTGLNPKDWIVFNIQQTGYYRILYDEENWKRLEKLLNSDDYKIIPAINRAQILNDAVQFSLKKLLDVKIFLNLVSYLARETDYVPWYDAQFIFSFLNYHLSNTPAHESFKKFCLKLLVPLVDKIGYEDRVDDDFSTLLLRRIGNHWSCHFGYENCWANATKQLENYLSNETSKSVAMDLQKWARCFGLSGANETIWMKMFKRYEENLSEDWLAYLSCSGNPRILNHFLNITISNDSTIPRNQVLSVFKSVCLYRSGDDKRINLCLNVIHSNINEIKLSLGNSSEAFTYLLDLLASEIRQKQQLQLFQEILNQEGSSLISNKLNDRIKQIENHITIFEKKASYYDPYLKEKLLNFQ